MNSIDAISFAGLLLQPVLVAALVVRRVWRQFPFFVGYCVSNTAATLALYPLRHRTSLYFWGYWTSELVSVLLGFCVVYEVFRKVFENHTALKRLAKRVFRWTLAGLVALGLVVLYSHAAQQAGFRAGIMTIEEATRIIEVGLLLFLFLFSAAFGLHWRQQVFGIALGLGIFTAVELAALAMRLQFGIATTPTFNLMRAASFNLSLLTWIGYVFIPEKMTTTELPKTAQLEQWNQAIMELIHQ